MMTKGSGVIVLAVVIFLIAYAMLYYISGKMLIYLGNLQ